MHEFLNFKNNNLWIIKINNINCCTFNVDAMMNIMNKFQPGDASSCWCTSKEIMKLRHSFNRNYWNLNILRTTSLSYDDSHWMDKFCYPSYDWSINLKFIGRLEGTDWILASDWSNH